MAQGNLESRFRTVGDGTGLVQEDLFYREEVQLALRNRGMPLEGLRYPVTPAGMHYLLIHFDIPAVEADTWQLRVGGLVSDTLNLTLEDLRRRPARTLAVTMECAGNGRALLSPRSISQPWLLEAIGTAEWTGTPLRGVLAEAGMSDQATEILFTGLDQGVQGGEVQYYQRSLTVAEATADDVLLAYSMNGQPLPPQHGFPLRLIVPGWYGMTHVKWLDRIEAIDRHFDGYQMEQTYRYCEGAGDPGEPVDRIRVRSLMVPPGIPDFLTRARLVPAGPVEIIGRAWAGGRGITRVEFSDDGGRIWADAALGAVVGQYAWREWSYPWDARPGRYRLGVRATDSEGNIQPVEQPWNYQGMGNNMVHRVEVLVE
jgi:DMSO/TMAO reductase YedYZ molybdopterin-dependent catalytic subunit